MPQKNPGKYQVQNYVPYALPFWGMCFTYGQILTYLHIFEAPGSRTSLHSQQNNTLSEIPIATSFWGGNFIQS